LPQRGNLLSGSAFPPLLTHLERAAGRAPRFLIHGAVALVTFGTIGSVVVQSRPSATPVQDAAPADEPATLALAPLTTTAEDTSQAAAAPAPAEEAAAAEPATPNEPAPAPSLYTVEEGDTVRMLAAKYGISPETILAANNLRDPDLLSIGQELIMLPVSGVLHTVAEGESLRRLAAAYEVDMATIVGANDFGGNPDVVLPGTKVVIPGATPALPGRTSGVAQAGEPEQTAATIGVRNTVTPPRAVPSTRTYAVERGDTLGSIAATFGVDVETILSSNGIGDPDTIKPGVELRILPVKGLEYAIQPGETLADIAWKYQVDLGLLLDYNDLDNPDVIRVGNKLIVPGARLRADAQTAPPPSAPIVRPGGPAVAPAAPAPAPKPAAPAPAAPRNVVGPGGANVVANAMKYMGYRYVFGGTSPAGFDCSGFVYYIHNATGNRVGRGMWQQYNGGNHIPMNSLVPGDTVFFANTYMPGLSHNGIYIGNGQFIHASDPSSGVTISSMSTAYWSSRYVGATRLW
jgi:cell wall-associated NlpC family hydrolase